MEKFEQERLNCLPYGQWHTKDGSVVLFDREHRPIFAQGDKGDIEFMKGDEWINDIVQDRTEYFYDDRKTPEMDFYTLAKVKKVLADWMMKYQQQRLSRVSKPKSNKQRGN